MRVAITGSNGLLGTELSKTLESSGFEVIKLSLPYFNITDISAVTNFFKNNNDLDFFINCAAYTNVPKAEEEQETSFLVNGQSLATISKMCSEFNIHLIHFSTDFVFDGEKNSPYTETDKEKPINNYGVSKLMGESELILNMKGNNCFTLFRLQWLFGNNMTNFFEKILSSAKLGNTIKLVDDEYGSPCSANFISSVILKIIQKENIDSFKGELFHLTHNDSCSRYECGKYFLENFGFTRIEKVVNLPMVRVKRPKYSVMDNSKLSKVLGESLGSWKEDIDNFIRSK